MNNKRIIAILFVLLMIIGVIVSSVYFDKTKLFNRIVDVPANKTQTTQLNPMLSNEKSLIIFSPVEQSTDTVEPTFYVCGLCLPSKELKINNNVVNVEGDGSFVFNYKLSEGENKIEVTNGDFDFNYTVNYTYCLIKSVLPQSDITLCEGMTIDISAEVLKGSKVYAMLGETKIELEEEPNDTDFSNYKAKYLIPDKYSEKTELGNIEVFAQLDAKSDKAQGGKVTVLNKNKNISFSENGIGEIVKPNVNTDGSIVLLTPNEDHSKGKALMCKVNKDYAEVVPASTADDMSDPRYSPELKGTIDYIVGEFACDDSEYYILDSGVKIEKENVDTFEGFVMPMNSISSVDVNSSTVKLTMNWKVPFISEVKEQKYYTGHAGRVFNVKDFNASYIDFVFKYTNATPNDFDFSSSSIVSYAKWIDIGKNGTSTLRIFLKNSGKYYGYKAYYANDNRLAISFKEKPARSNSIVYIDAGHGGKDCGAIGANGMYESYVNLNIAAMIKANLEAAGITVKMSRNDDTFYTLDERQAFGRSSNADVFVALHNNSNESSSFSGPEVYYYRGNSFSLASKIHSKLVLEWQGIYADNSVMYHNIVPNDGGIRFYPFRVIRIEECPSVLVECGYLSNPTECEMLCKQDIQSKMANAVSDGIIDYLNENY